jgi:hypothetical protein
VEAVAEAFLAVAAEAAAEAAGKFVCYFYLQTSVL